MPITASYAEEIIIEQKFESRLVEAKSIVKGNVLWATGLSIVPVPLFDLVGIMGVQIKMLKQLSDLYEIPFMEHKVKNILGSLLTGIGAVGVGGVVTFSLLKLVPFMGQVAGAIAIPITAGAFTLAVGRIFTTHFEAGGTFLDFNATAMRKHFREEFEKAKLEVAEMKAAAEAKSTAEAKVSTDKKK